MPFPLCDIRKNPRSMYARVPQAMAQIVLKIKIVPYHGANPNTRNGARLRSPSPIMAPERIQYLFLTQLIIVWAIFDKK